MQLVAPQATEGENQLAQGLQPGLRLGTERLVAPTAIGIPVVNDRNQNPHRSAPLPVKLAASTLVNAAQPLLQHEPARAQQLIGQGLRLDPALAAAYFNLGLALHHRGRIGAAIRAYRLALKRAEGPHGDALVQASALRNLAQDLLLCGRFREGWELYEHRLAERNHSLFEAQAGHAWRGLHDPRPLTRLLLVAEQGLGDTLMFCRLGISLQQHLNIPVSLLCQQPVQHILRSATPLAQVSHCLSPSDLQPPGSRWCPLLSLPRCMHLNPAGMALQQPYLQQDPALVEQWRLRLQRRPGLRLIALHWQGNPRHEGSLYSQGRSLPFEALVPLGQLPGVEFVSVQKGDGHEQLRHDAGLQLVRGQQRVSASMEFSDTAAVLANCDLLISADSAVVHLAGGLGLPAWVALCHVPEWRWGLQGERTPWYPSLTLFRQGRAGDWGNVIGAMASRWRGLYH